MLAQLVSLFPAALAPGHSWVKTGQTEVRAMARGQANDWPVLFCWAHLGIRLLARAQKSLTIRGSLQLGCSSLEVSVCSLSLTELPVPSLQTENSPQPLPA